ncbi:uncharacterized protein NPIL_8961 [Nephila pilipes]|uniref:Uncharacterized protein n=1 Tax=Nephila pilipes TaxID=299642 RepID=A0A8X6UKM4_NEPPI|nr:uncharacterized protein NPIL_8961 [Nephila pilipes]
MITTHQDPLEQYLDSQVPELKEENPSSVTDAGLLKSSNQSVLPCTRANETEKNSELIFGEKIVVCADTGASHTIAGEKLFKFRQEHDITFANKIISFMRADGIRQTITALSTVINLYIEGKIIPTEFLVLPEAKGNKTLLERDFLNAAGIVLASKAENGIFSKILKNSTNSSRNP